jgi:hypothetical protein
MADARREAGDALTDREQVEGRSAQRRIRLSESEEESE